MLPSFRLGAIAAAIRVFIGTITSTDNDYDKVVLLLHGNGANGSTTITDSSKSPKTMTAAGNTQISTAQSKFGGASIYFDGTVDAVTVPYSSDFDFGAGDFTIEMWVYKVANNANSSRLWNANGDYYSMVDVVITSGGNLGVYMTTNGTAWNAVQFDTVAFPSSQWVHLAVVRNGGNADAYINGTKYSMTTSLGTAALVNGTGGAAGRSIGGQDNGTNRSLHGYIDDVRITKGKARYTDSFSPPSLEFADSWTDPYLSNTVLLLLGNGANGSTTITDSREVPKTVTAVGNAAISTTQSKYGGASIAFDGTGDYLTVPHSSDFSIQDGDFTLEAWVYRSASGASHYLLSKRPNSATNNGWEWRINADNTLQFFHTAGSSLISSGTIPSAQWVFIATVRSGTTVTHYINGVASGSGTFTNGTENTADTLKVGIANDLTASLNGYLDDLRITKGVARYTAAFTPPQMELPRYIAPLPSGDYYFGNTALLLHGNGANASTAIFDSSPSPKTITVSGNAQITTTEKKFGGSSMYFDASGDYLTVSPGISFASGDFTIEYWVYFTSTISLNPVMSRRSGANGYWLRSGYDAGNLSVLWQQWTTGGTYQICQADVPGHTLNTWVHVCFERVGNVLTLYTNGVARNTLTTANRPGDPGTTTQIGQDQGAPGATLNGYIDDLRITTGVARYAGAFTPPASQHADHWTDPYISDVVLLLQGNGANSSTTILDGSNLSNVVTTNGNAAISTTQSKFGGSSLSFDGTGDYLSIPSNANLTFGTGDFTIEFWVRFNATNSFQRIVSSTVGAFTTGTVVVRLNSSGAFYAIAGGAAGIASTTVATAGVWYHIAFVRASNVCKLYVDGVAQAATETATNSSTEAIRYVGGYYTVGPAEYLNGYIDDLRITKGRARYTASFTPPIAPFPYAKDNYLANTVLLLNGDGADGSTTIVDKSPTPKTITASGNAQISTAQSRFGGSALYMDGNGDYLTVPSSSDFEYTGDFTVELWIHPLSWVNNCSWIDATVPAGFAIVNNGTTSWKVTRSNTSVVLDNLTLPSLNSWHHIAVSRSGSTLRAFVDGVLAGSVTDSGTFIQTGVYVSGIGIYAFNGYIDDVRITKGVARYTEAFTPPTQPFPYGQDPYFANTVLLLHGNGTNGSTTIVDSSALPSTVTAVGNAAISTTQSKFGGSSIYLDGTGDYLTVPNSVFSFGTGNFTIEGWFYPTSFAVASRIFYGGDSATVDELQVVINTNGTLSFETNNGIAVATGGLVSLNTWNHVALVRNSGAVKLYTNGSLAASGTDANDITVNINAAIGVYRQSTLYFQGYVDDIRITKGVARYTAAFTPPTQQFLDA